MDVDVDFDVDASATDFPSSMDPPLVVFDAALAETSKSEMKSTSPTPDRRSRGFCSQLGFVVKVFLSLIFGSVFQILDWVTDVETIRLYVGQRRLLFAGILSATLLVYLIVAAIVGLRRLRQRPDLYATLWDGHWVTRAITVLLHCLGLGQVPLSFDLAAERLKVRFGEDVKKEDENRLIEKTKHYVSMSLLQTFLESLPQLLLQTVFFYIKESYGTKDQCFPSFADLKRERIESELKLSHISSNGSVATTEHDCDCDFQTHNPTNCNWPIDWVLVVSVVMSLTSLALNVIRHGPIAWINEESQLEDEDCSYSMAIEKSRSTIAKAILYPIGLAANLFGCLGFLAIFISWTMMTSRWFFFLIPSLLLQITQPNWLAFMWHRIRRRDLNQMGGVARHRGVWWRFFLTASPFAYVIATAPLAVIMFLNYTDESTGSGDTRPIIRFYQIDATTSSDCAFALVNVGVWDEKKWRVAIADIYSPCTNDPGSVNATDSVAELELGNQYVTSPGTWPHVVVRIAAIFFGVSFNLLQMATFRKKRSFSRRVVVWPILLGATGILNELLIAYNQNEEGSEMTFFFFTWVFFYLATVFVVVFSALFLLCRKCFPSCCRFCCGE